MKTITEEEILSLGAYEIEEHRFLKDPGSDSFLLRHKKTGARLAIMPNEDTNKVFYIAFRTPPVDSTGVAHIIEHTVLCGSKDFPVKDPFIELVKGSLNTFLNAMTYPDKTVYPVASTNDKDFANLMHVYLDAVFHPNIYSNENIFRQEGWHYEIAPDENGVIDENSKITVNGVVYNEMKGVMSSPDDVLGDKVLRSLYPHTTYANVSGGDPECIPQLTYEKYLDFHRKYYHPSNSYIYLYGNMDMLERLAYIDQAYLSGYDYLEVHSEIVKETPFSEATEENYTYSVMSDEDTEGKTFLSLNYSIDVNGNAKENQAFKILDYILCDSEGAPVKNALRKKGIGEDVESIYEQGIRQPYYSIMAKYTNEERKEEFVSTIRETLENLVQNGIDEKSLAAGINYFEFSYREADYGSYPKGLVYGLDALDTWLYDDKTPWLNLDIGDLFDELREEAGSGYFEKLIEKHLLHNDHKTIVVLSPEQGLTEKKDAEQAAALKAFSGSISSDERMAIANAEKSLREWQETPDSKEDYEKIPLLSRGDLGRKVLPYKNIEKTVGDIRVLSHPVFTSGIDYTGFVFNITDMPERLFKYLGVFKTLVGALDTENYSYQNLDNECNIYTGGITPSVGIYDRPVSKGGYCLTFELNMKALHENFEKAIALVLEILTKTKYDDTDRILEVLEEERSAAKSELPSGGHMTALTRALSYISVTSALLDEVSGIGSYRILDQVCRNFDKEKDTLPALMLETAQYIFRKERLLFDITCDEKGTEEDLTHLASVADALFQNEIKQTEKPYVPELSVRNEGFTTAGQIQFVCRAGNFKSRGFAYTGYLRVLKVIMGYDYLWNKVRVKGGAYGCMSGFAKEGNAYFVSYRDPHLQQTIDVFKEAGEYIRSFDADDRTMTKYVIGAISTLDRPLSPSMFGRYSLMGYMTGFTTEEMQKERDEVLSAEPEDIRALGNLLDAFMEDGCLCVVGNAEKIAGHKELFKTVTPLV